MSEPGSPKGRLAGETREARAERLAAELRANLAKRKAQAKARKSGSELRTPEGSGGDSSA